MTSPRRNRSPMTLPTAAELDILAVLWRLGTATVREVHDALGKDNGYTTTLKQMLSSQPWVDRLGWPLVHFVWQGLSIAVLYAAARRGVARTSSPNAQYLLACAALAAMMAAPLVTWGLMGPADASLDAAYRIR